MLESGTTKIRRRRKIFVVAALFAAGLTGAKTHAAPADICSSPPYGGTIAGYKAFAKNLGFIVPPVKIYSAVCRAKFQHGDRTGLYNLGIVDDQIDRESVDDLVIQVLTAMKQLVDKAQ